MLQTREENSASVYQEVVLHAILLLLILAGVVNIVHPHLFWEHVHYQNIAVHSAIEAFGALAAIVMALVSRKILQQDYHYRYVFVSMGFLAMGAWDLFHACLAPGKGFVLTHNLSLLSGGFLFALICVPWPLGLRRYSRHLFAATMVIVFLSSMTVLVNRSIFPPMIHEGEFSKTAELFNTIAAVLFLAAFGRLYLDYRKSKKTGYFLLASFALLSGLAGLVFPYSQVWTDNWWLWHILRLISYFFILGFMMLEHQKLFQQREDSLAKLQSQHQQLLRLFNGIDDAIYIADPETHDILYVNDAVKNISGDDIIGKKCYIALQNRETPCPFCTNEKILKNKGEAAIWEFQNEMTKDWFRCFDKAIQWTGGRWVRFQIATNINDLKENENQLRKINAELSAFNKMAVGREKRMVELKKIINNLSMEIGKEPPYDTAFAE